jgi:putative acetyltransferase
MFHDGETLEETIAIYATRWPLNDIDTYQESYLGMDGAFLVTSYDGRIIGTGALRRMDEITCEIKRVWLLPRYHGLGLGFRMIQALLEISREKGYSKVRLKTNPTSNQRAFQLYLRLGFYEVPPYGDDPDDHGMEMIL